eukprot:1403450-Pyramimonas_sp.AAC.2
MRRRTHVCDVELPRPGGIARALSLSRPPLRPLGVSPSRAPLRRSCAALPPGRRRRARPRGPAPPSRA